MIAWLTFRLFYLSLSATKRQLIDRLDQINSLASGHKGNGFSIDRRNAVRTVKTAERLNSNQAQTVIQGSGQSGKLLLIKDSYGNSFAQSPAEDYTEVHVLDLRFFKGDVTEYARENGITDALVLYGTQNFVKDTNLTF